MKYQAPRGTYDILPQDIKKWHYIESIIRHVTTLNNYFEVRVPIFEQLDLFQRSVGEDTDIVEKEMYTFQDKKGRELALRPEGTASIARMVVDHALHSSKREPLRLWYEGPMFRYSRPQKGRYRQFVQFGIECIGSSNPIIDSEVIAIGWQILQEAKVPDVSLEINSVGCPECRSEYNILLKEYLTKDKEKYCTDCQRRMEHNPLRVFDCKNEKCQQLVTNAPRMLDNLCNVCKEHFDGVEKYLDLMNVPYVVNPEIVRGLDYYTKTAFEYKINYLGAQDALGGGGRYDGLIEYLGGPSTPAVGLSMGLERIILSLEKSGFKFPDTSALEVLIIPIGNEAIKESIGLMQELHSAEISALIADEDSSVGSNLKYCDKNNIPFAILIGETELRTGMYVIKDIQQKDQSEIQKNEVVTYIKSYQGDAV
ncbi:MAG: histidine--tRNA ligase [Candidatus Cloacimonetes bacterium]|nr:histidine--tRNA ligase [Candidatus Cloacimonadota bacterium]